MSDVDTELNRIRDLLWRRGAGDVDQTLEEVAAELRRELLGRQKRAQEDLQLAKSHFRAGMGEGHIDGNGKLNPRWNDTPVGRAYRNARDRASAIGDNVETTEQTALEHLRRFLYLNRKNPTETLARDLDKYLSLNPLHPEILARTSEDEREFAVTTALMVREAGLRIIRFLNRTPTT